jgi:peptide/nickel transport system substrate-binding protein
VAIPVGGAPSALAYGSGSLWVTDGDGRSVAQVDPGTNKLIRKVPVGNAPRATALAGGTLWVASGVEGGVKGFDLDKGHVRTIEIGAIPTALAAGAGALWVASEEAGTVTRIDPRSGAVVAPVNVGNGPTAVATGEGAVWVVNRGDGTLSRVDPATNAVSWTVRVGADPRAVAAGGGAVWVAGGEDATVVRVDPHGPRVLARLHTGSSPTALTVAGGSVWTAATATAAAHRGGTLHARYWGPGRLPVDWVDRDGYFPATWQLSSLAYDGLVAYPRVGGAAGPTLVGALATRAPTPSPDGRTYVFTLRRGLRYSDGTLVQPEDFRASMERTRVVAPDWFAPYFAHIVGAQACRRQAAHCDLSRGIETDRRARTITVHLTRPDGDFLHKLTVPFAFVVPADTPARAAGDHPPPGTGPYRVAMWDQERGAGTFVRNPYFRSWSPEARPDGFADRIEVRQDSRPVKAQIEDVQRGRADWFQIADAFGSLLGPQRLAGLSTRAAGKLHSDPQPTTAWMFLNVRRRPFDSLRVRRAVNLAADRARLVALSGGPETAIATCQMIPTAFPGHVPYCPYTAAPTVGGGWTAPDFARARRLVSESGRTGERVVVRVPSFRRAIGRYFVELLDDLGFRASLRVQELSPYFASVQDPRSRAQIGFVGWAMDYASPSDLLRLNFSCPSGSGPIEQNQSRICDPTITRLVKRARAAPMAESARGWAAVDRRVTDLAAVVSMTNLRSVVLVSKRVGNVQHQLQWSTLLDQMWVR